jgi:multiple sugar transport system substrate-binding protein
MIEISFSFIPDTDEDVQTVEALLDRFKFESGVRVNLQQMTWDDAWNNLLDIALRGRGAEVSLAGSSWISSLMSMGALRPFSTGELTAIGRANAFLNPAWQSAMMADDDQVWTIPFSSYFYVTVYRRDLFTEAGLVPEETFGAQQSLARAAAGFKSAGLKHPWFAPVLPVEAEPPFMDLLHFAAGMIWSAGGDIVGPGGRHTLVHLPAAREGIKAFLELGRHLNVDSDELEVETQLQELSQGHVAAVILDARTLYGLEDALRKLDPDGKFGALPLSKVPWYGGENLVIWRHARSTPETEKAAVDLVTYLSSRQGQILFARRAVALPARLDAVNEVFSADHLLGETFRYVAEHGRAYPSISLWRRIEFQLAEVLHEIRQEYRQDPDADVDALLDRHLTPFARRLDLTLA